MRKEKLYIVLARTLQAYDNARRSGNAEWMNKHLDRAKKLVHEYMPSGSGFDSGTKLDIETSLRKRQLVFDTAFHHMDEHGSYSGWTEHTVTIVPSLVYGFQLKISGRDRNQIKREIGEAFQYQLEKEISEY